MDEVNPKIPHVLIVGDWVIDEYWYLLKHHSKISAHTGLTHFRLASKPGDIVADLCGAGHIARSIYEISEEQKKIVNITGIGIWNERDTNIIKHLIHARSNKTCHSSSLGFSINPEPCDETPQNIKLITLMPNKPTIRVIRQYRHGEEGLYQVNRIDWEPEFTSEEVDYQNICSEISPPNLIIIQDLKKGTVTEEFIKVLLLTFPNAFWSIRTKNEKHDWVKLIPKNKFLLNIIGSERTNTSPRESWLVNGKLTAEAVNYPESEKGNYSILLSDHNEIILKSNINKDCFIGISPLPVTSIIHLGWSTAICSILLFRLLCNKFNGLDKRDLDFALQNANRYSGVPIPESLRNKQVDAPPIQIISSNWENDQKDWEAAFNPDALGLIEYSEGKLKKFEIWRGSPILPGYITVVKKKQEIIRGIYQKLKEFKNSPDQTRSLNILLQADPGAGKTYLAKCLANYLDFDLVRYDITQMIHRDDLLDLFETVATRQARNQKKILVFVDEINAQLDGYPVYGAFLTPLEENFYIHHGKYFSIQPCAWLFAGTYTEENEDESKQNAKDKYADFKSRMSVIHQIDYKSLTSIVGKDQLEKEIRLEQVYLGASLIKSTWPDVNDIHEEILKVFYQINPSDNSTRKIRKLVSTIENLQYGIVKKENCKRWEEYLGVNEWSAFMPTNEEPIRLLSK